MKGLQRFTYKYKKKKHNIYIYTGCRAVEVYQEYITTRTAVAECTHIHKACILLQNAYMDLAHTYLVPGTYRTQLAKIGFE